jgi:hypothetical protein
VLAGRPDVALRYRADTRAFIGLVIKPNGSVGYVLGQQLF